MYSWGSTTNNPKKAIESDANADTSPLGIDDLENLLNLLDLGNMGNMSSLFDTFMTSGFNWGEEGNLSIFPPEPLDTEYNLNDFSTSLHPLLENSNAFLANIFGDMSLNTESGLPMIDPDATSLVALENGLSQQVFSLGDNINPASTIEERHGLISLLDHMIMNSNDSVDTSGLKNKLMTLLQDEILLKDPITGTQTTEIDPSANPYLKELLLQTMSDYMFMPDGSLNPNTTPAERDLALQLLYDKKGDLLSELDTINNQISALENIPSGDVDDNDGSDGILEFTVQPGETITFDYTTSSSGYDNFGVIEGPNGMPIGTVVEENGSSVSYTNETDQPVTIQYKGEADTGSSGRYTTKLIMENGIIGAEDLPGPNGVTPDNDYNDISVKVTRTSENGDLGTPPVEPPYYTQGPASILGNEDPFTFNNANLMSLLNSLFPLFEPSSTNNDAQTQQEDSSLTLITMMLGTMFEFMSMKTMGGYR